MGLDWGRPGQVLERDRVAREVGWLPSWTAHSAARVEAVAVERYASAIGCDPTGPLPLFTFVLASAPLMGLLGQTPAMRSAVHVSHRMEQTTPLRIGEEVSISAAVAGVTPSDLGSLVAFELTTTAADGTPRNRQLADIWLRGIRLDGSEERAARGDRSHRRSRQSAPDVDEVVVLDPDQATRYADASGDHNPVHLDDEIAASVGFPRAIVHGMCTLALAVHTVMRSHKARADVKTLSVRFGRPVLRGDALRVRAWLPRADEPRAAATACRFEASTGDKAPALRAGAVELLG